MSRSLDKENISEKLWTAGHCRPCECMCACMLCWLTFGFTRRVIILEATTGTLCLCTDYSTTYAKQARDRRAEAASVGCLNVLKSSVGMEIEEAACNLTSTERLHFFGRSRNA